MNINAYNLVFPISNIFHTYIIYRFMCVFFDRSKVNKKIEFLSYAAFYLLLTFIHLVIKIPIITMLFNIIAFFSLSFNYQASIKKRLLTSTLIYIILLLVEIIIAALSLFSFTSNTNLSSVSGEIITKIVSFIVMLVMENFKNIKKGFYISNIYWISIFFIPLGTLATCFLLLQYINLNANHILISITILLFMNIITFYLYDALNKSFEERIENLLIKEQNKSYQSQLSIMESSVKNVSSIRHDMKNHLFAISTYINNNEKAEAINYISHLIKLPYGDKEYARSGNLDIDSILNYKFLEAESKGISLSLELKIPSELSVSSFDMVVVLCNLLDNSINASSNLNDNKKINVSIVYKKSILFIHIENTFDGNVIYENNKIITTNKDKENHGIGLSNIKNVIDKYDGTMEINHADNTFVVDIMMYINETSAVLI